MTLVIVFFALSLFWNLSSDYSGISNKTGAIMFIAINQVMTAIFSTLMNFLNEKEVFYREYANKSYDVFAYFASKSIVELPY